jgi:antitoxin component of MazEF toxin-antitoxin module
MEVTVKRIGNSLGIILKKEIVRKLNIKPGDVLIIKIDKKLPKKAFGVIKKSLDPDKVKFENEEKW